jgi:hypothetical protein
LVRDPEPASDPTTRLALLGQPTSEHLGGSSTQIGEPPGAAPKTRKQPRPLLILCCSGAVEDRRPRPTPIPAALHLSSLASDKTLLVGNGIGGRRNVLQRALHRPLHR